MTTGGLWWLARGVPLHQWGPREFLNALVVGLLTGIVTVVVLHLQVRRRARVLAARAAASNWAWACIARIRVGEQLVSGPGVRPIFKGPVGSLTFDGRQICFAPNRFCRKRGYVERSWDASEVVAKAEDSRRDPLSGLAYQDIQGLVGGHRVRLFISYEVGERPLALRTPKPT